MLCEVTRNLERVGTNRKEELYSWDAEVHLHRRLFHGTVSNIIETFVFRQESVCTDVLGSRNVLPEFR